MFDAVSFPTSVPSWGFRLDQHEGPPNEHTFEAAYPPEPGVRQATWVLLVLVLGLLTGDVGGVADEGAGIEPVISADGNGHKAKGCKGPHGGQKDLDPLLAPHHSLLIPALQGLQLGRSNGGHEPQQETEGVFYRAGIEPRSPGS